MYLYFIEFIRSYDIVNKNLFRIHDFEINFVSIFSNDNRHFFFKLHLFVL